MAKASKTVKQQRNQPVLEKDEKQTRSRTPTFICEIPLRVTSAQEHTLLVRLEAARQTYNACLGEAKRRVGLIRQSKRFQRAHALPKDDPTRTTRFSEARAAYQFNEYALHAYAGKLRHSWLGQHLDSLTVQKLASRAYKAANKLLLGQARRIRFKGRNQMDSVEGKNNTSGIRWCGDHVEWSGLILPGIIDARDEVLSHGLASRVKYVRLVRRKLGEQTRFYAQLICEGVPYRKKQHGLGEGVVGLDLGPQTLAIVSEHYASLQMLCPDVAPNAKRLRQMDRKLDRQRRANNPTNYDERGRVKKGAKQWKVSNRQQRTQSLRNIIVGLQLPENGVMGKLPIRCWLLATRSILRNSPTVPGKKTSGNQLGFAHLPYSSHGCPVWPKVLTGPSCRSIQSVRNCPKHAIAEPSN